MKQLRKIILYPYIIILLLLSWIVVPFLYLSDFIVNELRRLGLL